MSVIAAEERNYNVGVERILPDIQFNMFTAFEDGLGDGFQVGRSDGPRKVEQFFARNADRRCSPIMEQLQP